MSDAAEPTGPWWERLGSAALVASVWSAFAALSAALRVASDGDVPMSSAWPFCAALAVLPMLAAIAVLRVARAGLRALGGEDGFARIVAAAAWLVVMTGALDRLGALMRSKTHHHALAGATFALVALVLGVGLALLAARFRSALGSRNRQRIAAACVAFVAALVVRDLARGLSSVDPLTHAWLVDLAAFSVTAFFGALTPPLTKWPARLGPLVLVALLIVGWRASANQELAPRLREHAPLFAGMR